MDKPLKLGKYTLTEQIGSGGFGTVYKATDSSGRIVAVKVLKPGWNDDPSAVDRFRREAHAAGQLFHSQIATITDFDEADGRLFLVMRYIEGISLDQLIKQKGRIEWQRTIQILEQVAAALDYAHQRGLIHRDIKPANILISEKDGAVLTDFGLVKAVDASGMSTTGVMLGTPAYIAPEIWEGKTPATPQTDIYSLACVAYEMLTGQVLFAGSSPPEIMNKHLQPTPPLPAKLPQGLPATMRNVLTQALQPNLEKRYPNVQTFLADLKKYDTSLKQETIAKIRSLAREAEGLIQHNELAKAHEILNKITELMPDAPVIAELGKKIETMTRLNGVYDEVIEDYQSAQEKARSILAENSIYPDHKHIFPALGLRSGKPAKIKPSPISSQKPEQTENLEPRWQEKTLPYLLIILGLISTVLWGLGFIGVVAGIGLLWHKNWARKTGVFFALLLEIVGFVVSAGTIVAVAISPIYESQLLIPPAISLVGCLIILLAFYLLKILNGQRLGNRIGVTLERPGGIWMIFGAYFVTIIGILPAILLFTRKTVSRRLAQGYALLLTLAVPILGFIAVQFMKVPFQYFNLSTGYWDYSYSPYIVGYIWTSILALFFIILTILAFRYFRSPKIRAYYQNEKA